MPDDTKIKCEICGKVLSTRGLNGHRQSKQCQDIAARKSKKSKFVEEPNENKPNVTIEIKPVVVPVQKVTKTIELKQPKSEAPAIQTTEPVINHVQDKKTKPAPKQEGEWDGEFF